MGLTPARVANLTPAAERILAGQNFDHVINELRDAVMAGFILGDWSAYPAAYERLQAAGNRVVVAAHAASVVELAGADDEATYYDPAAGAEIVRSWCCRTPLDQPHTPGCGFEPRPDEPIDYLGPVEIRSEDQ